MNIREASKFRAFNRMVGALARRDLTLLNKIDETIDCLCEMKAEMDILADAIAREIEPVKAAPAVIDEDGKIISMLEQARDAMHSFGGAMKAKCEAARTAPELHPDDGVVEAYCELIASTAGLQNALNELCWAIGEHDVSTEDKWLGPFDDVEEMLRALKA